MKEIKSAGDPQLQRLYRLLSLELSSPVLLILYWLHPFLVIIVLFLAAILFAPFMIKILFNQKRYGWIVAFFIMVVLPLLLNLIPSDNTIIKYIFITFPLITFYLFSFTLRFSVADWVEESRWRRIRELRALN